MNLGLYGTLLDPDVRAAVLGEAWRNAGQPALLHGWARFYVAGRVYPGIRPQPAANVEVLVLYNIDSEALAAADAFEGDEYTREWLSLRYNEGGGTALEAIFYVPKPTVQLSNCEWRYDDVWRNRYRRQYLDETRAIMKAARQSAGGQGQT